MDNQSQPKSAMFAGLPENAQMFAGLPASLHPFAGLPKTLPGEEVESANVKDREVCAACKETIVHDGGELWTTLDGGYYCPVGELHGPVEELNVFQLNEYLTSLVRHEVKNRENEARKKRAVSKKYGETLRKIRELDSEFQALCAAVRELVVHEMPQITSGKTAERWRTANNLALPKLPVK